MVSMILLILKIIGIILLVILGLLFAGVLVILFVPVRYQATGYYHSDYLIQLDLTWLMHIFHISYHLSNENARGYEVFIFGKPYKKKKKQKKTKRKQENKTPVEYKEASIQKEDNNSEQKVDVPNTEEKRAELPKKSELYTEAEKRKVSFWDKMHMMFRAFLKQIGNIKYLFLNLCDTIKKVREKSDYYFAILKSSEFQQAFVDCKKQFHRILRHVRPKKMDVMIRYGSSQKPDQVGMVLAVWGMMYPFHRGNVKLDASFETDILEADFSIKGHMTLFVHLKTLYLCFFDKNIKYLKECVMREA